VLKEKFNDNLEIIGFPCNQFWMQEPSLNHEMLNGIKYVRPGNGFVPNFPITAKIDVNGEHEHPLYSFLKRSCPPTQVKFAYKNYLYWEKFHERDIRWNFEKFLIDPRTGMPWRRYDPSVEPVDLVDDVNCLLYNFCTSSQWK